MTSLDGDEKPEKAQAETSTFRRVLPQILACSANNLILFDNGLVLSFPTIVIASLLNQPGSLSFNAEQASWFASISLICQPIGSLFSGLAMEPLGRKRSMLLLNVPFLLGWSLVYFANNIDTLYMAAAIMGFSVGCTEAPILTYVGEISEPEYRGTLTSYAQLVGSTAYFVVYLIGSLSSWRTTAVFCATVPVATVLAIMFIPETPLWLISRGRLREAENALCWLRGWVEPEAVNEEFQRLIAYKEMTSGIVLDKTLPAQSQENLIDANDATLRQRFLHFLRPQMMRPLLLIVSYFFFFYASGFQTIRPYLVPVLQKLQTNLDSDDATVIIALVGVMGYACCMVSVKRLGKRWLTLISLGGCAVTTFALSAVAGQVVTTSWAFEIMLAYSFFSSLGVAPIPWMLQSELYPFHGKCLAAGTAAAASYIIGFVATKTYLNVEDILNLDGTFGLFGVLSLAGLLAMYFCLPETEGRTFEEIAEHFDGSKRSKNGQNGIEAVGSNQSGS